MIGGTSSQHSELLLYDDFLLNRKSHQYLDALNQNDLDSSVLRPCRLEDKYTSDILGLSGLRQSEFEGVFDPLSRLEQQAAELGLHKQPQAPDSNCLLERTQMDLLDEQVKLLAGGGLDAVATWMEEVETQSLRTPFDEVDTTHARHIRQERAWLDEVGDQESVFSRARDSIDQLVDQESKQLSDLAAEMRDLSIVDQFATVAPVFDDLDVRARVLDVFENSYAIRTLIEPIPDFGESDARQLIEGLLDQSTGEATPERVARLYSGLREQGIKSAKTILKVILVFLVTTLLFTQINQYTDIVPEFLGGDREPLRRVKINRKILVSSVEKSVLLNYYLVKSKKSIPVRIAAKRSSEVLSYVYAAQSVKLIERSDDRAWALILFRDDLLGIERQGWIPSRYLTPVVQ